jgi:hypothetical protein
MNYKIAITTPIPSNPTKDFLEALPDNYDFIVVDDSNGKISLPKRDNIFIYDYSDQKKILGKYYDEYKAFHKSASCRNIAHFLAYKQGYDIVIALDYDCVVPKDFIKEQTEVYDQKEITGYETKTGWINPLENAEWFTRGFPYRVRGVYENGKEKTIKNPHVVLNMGLWKNVVDINAIDKVIIRPPKQFKLKRDHTAALGYIPLCGMNNSFLREVIPAYFFLPNFKIGNWDVSRHDDIWGGYIFQKLIEKRGDLITYGKPVVFHERESHQPRVLYYEHFMHILEPYFYELVDMAVDPIKKNDYQTMFADFAENFAKSLEMKKKSLPKPYYEGFKHQSKYISLWKTFFQKL